MRADDEPRWLALTLLFGAVGGSIAGVVGLAGAKSLLPWLLARADLEAGVVGGGVLGGGATFILAAAYCALRRDRPYPSAFALLIPLVASTAAGLLVFVGNLAWA